MFHFVKKYLFVSEQVERWRIGVVRTKCFSNKAQRAACVAASVCSSVPRLAQKISVADCFFQFASAAVALLQFYKTGNSKYKNFERRRSGS
jgi:hypothetical protein